MGTGSAVSAAFAAVPRAGFLPPGWRASADYDGPIPIGHGQTNPQPRTVEAMLRLLEVLPGPGPRRRVGLRPGDGLALRRPDLTGPTGRAGASMPSRTSPPAAT